MIIIELSNTVSVIGGILDKLHCHMNLSKMYVILHNQGISLAYSTGIFWCLTNYNHRDIIVNRDDTPIPVCMPQPDRHMYDIGRIEFDPHITFWPGIWIPFVQFGQNVAWRCYSTIKTILWKNFFFLKIQDGRHLSNVRFFQIFG